MSDYMLSILIPTLERVEETLRRKFVAAQYFRPVNEALFIGTQYDAVHSVVEKLRSERARRAR